jgi:hypothetical protein
MEIVVGDVIGVPCLNVNWGNFFYWSHHCCQATLSLHV